MITFNKKDSEEFPVVNITCAMFSANSVRIPIDFAGEQAGIEHAFKRTQNPITHFEDLKFYAEKFKSPIASASRKKTNANRGTP